MFKVYIGVEIKAPDSDEIGCPLPTWKVIRSDTVSKLPFSNLYVSFSYIVS